MYTSAIARGARRTFCLGFAGSGLGYPIDGLGSYRGVVIWTDGAIGFICVTSLWWFLKGSTRKINGLRIALLL
jgi:hypothetical protein